MLENIRDKSLVIIDDDEPFVRRLRKAMEKRGFRVSYALNVSEGKKIVKLNPPAFAVVDLSRFCACFSQTHRPCEQTSANYYPRRKQEGRFSKANHPTSLRD